MFRSSHAAGQALSTEDPRVGTGAAAGTPVAKSHSCQIVASKTLHKTDLRLTLGHVASSAQLARIDRDTGLQSNLAIARASGRASQEWGSRDPEEPTPTRECQP
jgi:hypothetical protein